MSKVKALFIAALAGLLFLGCVDAKSQWQNDIQAKMVEQTASARVVAQKIDALSQTVKTQVAENIDLVHKTIQAGSINYSGAGWAVLSAGVVVILFLGAGALGLYLLLRKITSLKSMLHLVTDAVQGTPAEVQDAVTTRIQERVADNATVFTERTKNGLAKFAKQMGNLAVSAIGAKTSEK